MAHCMFGDNITKVSDIASPNDAGITSHYKSIKEIDNVRKIK
jgi:hypothetical protein